MPTYEYECQKCGAITEKFQSITAAPLKKCPTCKGALKRLIGTGAGVVFKGSGFYSTDYRSPSYLKRAGEDKPAATKKTDACATCPKAKDASCAAKS